MPIRRAAVLDDRRAAELLVEGEEDPPRRHAARLEHEPGLAGLLLDRLAGVEQPVGAVERGQLPALEQPRLLGQLGVVVEDERVGVERDRVLAPARLAALPRLLEEALALEAVAREQLGRELLEQPGRGEGRQPGGVDDGDVGRRAADRGQRELRVVGVAPRQDQLAHVAVRVLGAMSARISVRRSPSPPPNRCQNDTVWLPPRERRAGVVMPSAAARRAPRRRSGPGVARQGPGVAPALPLHDAGATPSTAWKRSM